MLLTLLLPPTSSGLEASSLPLPRVFQSEIAQHLLKVESQWLCVNCNHRLWSIVASVRQCLITEHLKNIKTLHSPALAHYADLSFFYNILFQSFEPFGKTEKPKVTLNIPSPCEPTSYHSAYSSNVFNLESFQAAINEKHRHLVACIWSASHLSALFGE